MSNAKISIRFFNDREVRAIWDEENAKWWFSVLDVVAAINNEDDYSKSRNYWKYLKTKLKKENNQLVSITNQLKLLLLMAKCIKQTCSIAKEFQPLLKHFLKMAVFNSLIGLYTARTV